VFVCFWYQLSCVVVAWPQQLYCSILLNSIQHTVYCYHYLDLVHYMTHDPLPAPNLDG